MLVRWSLLLLVVFFCSAVVSFADQPPPEITNALKEKAVPAYPEATYCLGTVQMGVRFASKDDPEKVRKWYREQLPDWSVMDQYGSWILHEGPPDAKPPEVMMGKQILVMKNPALPSWHGLAADMTTEILISAP